MKTLLNVGTYGVGVSNNKTMSFSRKESSQMLGVVKGKVLNKFFSSPNFYFGSIERTFVIDDHEKLERKGLNLILQGL